MILCEYCELPAVGAHTLDDYPRSWRRPGDWGRFVPVGPRVTVLECIECECLWGIVYEPQRPAFTHERLPEALRPLLLEEAPLEAFLDLLTFDRSNRVDAACFDEILNARLKDEDAAALVYALLTWLEVVPVSAAIAYHAVLSLNSGLSRALDDPHDNVGPPASAGRAPVRDTLARRIDQGHALVDAAKLAHRDWQRTRTVVPLPQLRNLNVGPLVELLQNPPAAESDYEAGRLDSTLRQTLELIERAAQHPPQLTVSDESKKLLEGMHGHP